MKYLLGLFNVGGSTVLKYTDYKKKQALWIQRKNHERTDRGTNTEQFCMRMYEVYICICLGDENKYSEKIYELKDKIGTYHITTGDDFYKRGYDKNIADNIEDMMDNLIK